MPNKPTRMAPPGDPPLLLTDPEAAALLNLGSTRFYQVQKLADFPKSVWLGPRGKRHVRDELLQWALSQRARQT